MQHVTQELDHGELDDWAAQLSAGYLPPGWEPVPSSSFTRVAHHAGHGLYYKEFLPRSPMESFKARIRGSRASRARRNGDALLRAGFEAPRNLHWGELPSGREFLYSSAAPGIGCAGWLALHRADMRRRRAMLAALGVFVGRLHQSGFVHGDLRPDNVLVSEDSQRFRFTLIDNERNRRRRPPAGRQLLRNLMQLNMLRQEQLSTGDRWCFYRAWRSQMPQLTDEESLLLAREARRWADRRLCAQASGVGGNR